MQVPDRVQRVLRKFNVQITHYTFTPASRRARILADYGIADLIDVGANTGQYAQEVRSHGYAGRLWSFEPLGAPYATLAAAAAKDPAWRSFKTAVSDERADLVLHVSEDDTFSSAIPLASAEGRPAAVQVGTETVQADTLDNIVPALAGLQGPLGLKVDVQGHESAVFAGATETLKRAEFLEFEMSCVEIYQGQDLLPAMMQRMYDQGFVLAHQDPAWVMDNGRSLQMNGIFVRPTT